jgi:type II secretory pathway component PulK
MQNQPKALKSRGRKRGFALMIVMMLIILLAVLVFAFQRDVMRETAVTGNVRDDLKAAYLAQMAMVRGQVVLRLDTSADYDSLNEPWAAPLSWEGETWGIGYDETSDQQSPEPPGLIITDEERKFNLLTLVRGNELQRKRASEVLQRLIKICRREDDRLETDGLVRNVRGIGDDSISAEMLVRNLVSYLEERASEDSDDLEISANPTAEADVRGMKKQTPFEMLTIGELLQVEGWTEELLHGPVRRADAAYEQTDPSEEEEYRDWRDLTPEEKFERNRDSIESVDTRSRDPNHLGIAQFLTLYSTGLININTAPREIILALDPALTWLVVDQIMNAREAARQDVLLAEENGGTLPDPEPPPLGEEPTEEEDTASFRTQDLASYQAFVARINNQQTEEGQPPAEVEGFTPEIYTAIRPWLVVRSTVFEVLASATVGKVTHTIRVVYRRSAAAPAAQPNPPGQPGQPAPTPDPTQPPAEGDGLPTEPTIKLTLLFKDVANN